MSLKMKLTSTIMAFMLLASMLIVGVFAVKQTEFSVGGNIVFNASGINATISKGTMSGGIWDAVVDASSKMKEIKIDTSKSESQLAEEYESWSGLDLAFNEVADDVKITFTITNNATAADDYVVVYINVDNGTAQNAYASVTNTGAAIAGGETQTFTITFSVIEKDTNASLTGFNIGFDLRQSDAVNVTPETAQSVLDGDINNKVIVFGSGNYGNLELRPSKATSKVYTVSEHWYWYNLGEEVSVETDLESSAVYNYVRNIENINNM